MKCMRPPLEKIPQVALLLPAAVKVNRDMRRGILSYIHRYCPWSLHIIDGRVGGQELYRPEEWGCSGLFGRIFLPGQEKILRSLHVPKVLIDPDDGPLGKKSVYATANLLRCDTEAVGRFAAEYFLGKHFEHFAYVNEIRRVNWSLARGKAFAARIRSAGFDCAVYAPLGDGTHSDSGAARRDLAEWLKALPRPVAVYAATDARGRQVFDVASLAGLRVPADLAVLGTDNDEDLCDTTLPPMSSILLDAERAAYKAASVLDAAMRSGPEEQPPRTVITYGPAHIVERESCSDIRLSDPFISRAVEFITLNSCSSIRVSDVARHINVSRRFLEKRFASVFGRTVLDSIRSARLDHVCRLLRETTIPVSEVVAASGFCSQSYLGTLFRKRLGCSMRTWRANVTR